jgi:Domain of unknown function (DUF4279)
MNSWFDINTAEDLNIPRLRVSLRIRGDAVNPEFLTQQFGVAPSLSARKGETVIRHGRESVQMTGVWVYRLEVPPATELGEVIALLLEVFPEDSTLWGEITSAYTVDVLCGIFLEDDNQSTVVASEILAALGRRGWPLSLDCFAPIASARDAGA